MKTITVGTKQISVAHNIVTHPKTLETHVECIFEGDGKSVSHRMTIGSADGPLPASYDANALKVDVDAFKEKHAAIFEGKLRAIELAGSLTE
jgi:hypothetical protein